MKKIAILSIVFVGLAFAACKKERECECTETTSNNVPGSISNTDPVVKYEIREIKGSEAKTWCQKSTVVTTTGTFVSTVVDDCKLK